MLGASVIDLFTSGKNKIFFNEREIELRAERPEEESYIEEAESDLQSEEGEIV